jgi:hypothetical protein
VYKVDSNTLSLTKIKSDIDSDFINYYGNVDSLDTTTEPYSIYYGLDFTDKEIKDIESTATDPVRIKYKSAPHFTFRLKKASVGHQIILPTLNNLNKISSIIEGDVEISTDYGAFIKYSDENNTEFPDDADIGDL